MDGGLIFCGLFLLSKGIVLPIAGSRDSCHLPREGGQNGENPLQEGGGLLRQHVWCPEDGTAEHTELGDCFRFQELVLPVASRGIPVVQTVTCLVRGVPSSVVGIAVKSETGETNIFP